MLAIELLVGAGLLHGELAGLIVIGACGLKSARAALVKGVDGATQVFLELLLVKGVGKHGQVDLFIEIDRFFLGGGIGFTGERRDKAGGPKQRLVSLDDLACRGLAVDDRLVGFGLVGPAKVVARHGELVMLPCRVDFGGGRRGV